MPQQQTLNKYVAEFFGTFLLVLAVTFVFEYDLATTAPVIAALTLGILVYTIGPVSGAHVNPAVTIGLFGIGKMTINETVRYILAQLLGATLAIGVHQFLSGSFPAPDADIILKEYVAEFLGTMVLSFGVASAALGKLEKASTGIVVGGSLFVGILIASPFSLGLLNPAVAMGFHMVTLPYVVGPILGGLFGAWLRKYLG